MKLKRTREKSKSLRARRSVRGFILTPESRPRRRDAVHRRDLVWGFTLIELILYVALSAIILLAASILLSTLLQARVKNETAADVEQTGQNAMQIMTQTIRNANTINSP